MAVAAKFVFSTTRRQDDITSRRYGRSSYEAFAQPALTWVLSLCIIYSPRFDRVFVFGTAMTLATSSSCFWNRPRPLAISNRTRVFPGLRGKCAVILLWNDFCETCSQDTRTLFYLSLSLSLFSVFNVLELMKFRSSNTRLELWALIVHASKFDYRSLRRYEFAHHGQRGNTSPRVTVFVTWAWLVE